MSSKRSARGCEVDVAVDQARQDGRVREVDDLRARGNGAADGGDTVVLDLQGDVLPVRLGEAVEEAACLEVEGLWRGGEETARGGSCVED